MKINCGPTREEKDAAKKKWHRYFCLWPRRISNHKETNGRDCRWLETVERKGTVRRFGDIVIGYDLSWYWEYRAIK